MTLSGVALILRFFSLNLIALQADYLIVVEDKTYNIYIYIYTYTYSFIKVSLTYCDNLKYIAKVENSVNKSL